MDKQKVYITYYGQHESKGHLYIQLDNFDETKEVSVEYLNTMISMRRLLFSKKLFNGRPGTTYLVSAKLQHDLVHAVLHEDKRYIRNLANDESIKDLIAKWNLRHDAITRIKKAEKLRKTDESINAWREALKPIRLAYLQNPTKRAAILALVNEYILNGKI